MLLLWAHKCNSHYSPYSPFHQCIFKANKPYQPLVSEVLCQLGDPFIKGEVLQFHHLTQALQTAHQEHVNCWNAMWWAQQLELLANNAFIVTCMECFEKANGYSLLHTRLMRESIQHVKDDKGLAQAHELLYFQLQVAGWPQSPLIPNPPLSNLADCFNCTPFT